MSQQNEWQARIEQLACLPVAELVHRLETLAADEEPWLALLLIAQRTEGTLCGRCTQARLWYAARLLMWIAQHPWSARFSPEDVQTVLLHSVCARVFETLQIEHFLVPGMQGQVVRFLKMTVHTVIADEMRARQLQQHVEALAENGQTYNDAFSVSVTDLLTEFHDERDTALIYLAYVQGMKPSAIVQAHSHLFPTVEAVLGRKRDILERLRKRQAKLQGSSDRSK